MSLSLIQNNPYRILGIPITSTERELQKQITKSNRFTEVGKTITCDTDYLFLGDFERNSNSITKAAKTIEQPLDKLLYSSFWFLNSNHIDNLAMESLQKGNFEKALEVWEKVVGDGNISEKKFSNLMNLKTLYLGLSFKSSDGILNKNYLIKGIELSGKFLNNKEFKILSKQIVGDKFVFSIEKIEELFIDKILSDIRPLISKGIDISEITSAVKTFSSSTQFKISQKFSSGETNNIESEIQNTEELRKSDASNAFQFGLNLYENTKKDIDSLSKVLGKTDVKFQMIADKLASEILQCAIDYYNKEQDGFTDKVPLKALELCKHAEKLAIGGQLKGRIKDNSIIIQRAADEGIKFSNFTKDIISEMEKINSLIEKETHNFLLINDKNSPVSVALKTSYQVGCIDSAKRLSENSTVSLNKLHDALGKEDETYIKICDQVVTWIMALVIEYVNATAPTMGVSHDTFTFFSTLKFSGSVINISPSVESRYLENLNSLNNMYKRSNLILRLLHCNYGLW